MRQGRRADIGVVHIDLHRALVRDGNAVVAIAQMEAEIPLCAEVEIGRNAHVDGDRSGPSVCSCCCGDVAERVIFSVLSQRGASSGSRGAGILSEGMRTWSPS